MLAVNARILSLLIADDSDDLRNRLRDLITPLHYAEVVKEVSSAYEAIDLIEKEHFDAAILDIEMPGSGIRALKKIKLIHPDTEVIMLTNHTDPMYHKVCLEAGASYFLDKSLEFERISSALSDIASR